MRTLTTTSKRVAVALSGGVDSSVGAALLVEQGYVVEGVTLRLLGEWMDSSLDDETIRRADGVCEALGIAHHVIDGREAFKAHVIETYAHEYSQARTPNPCIVCNEHIKFGLLWDWAHAQGFDALATGHYADTDGAHLKRPVDRVKDQTYFMYRIERERLQRVLFPLAKMTKDEVKAYAKEHGLPSATSKESQDACFIEKGDRRDIVRRLRPEAFADGEIVTTDGQIVGTHDGIAHYTVGQRRGLGVGGRGEPLYVVRIDHHANQVVIGTLDETRIEVLHCDDFVIDKSALGVEGSCDGASTAGRATSTCSMITRDVMVMVRYNTVPVPARLEIAGKVMTIALQSPISGISRGQSAVCYVDDVVVAGGVITCVS